MDTPLLASITDIFFCRRTRGDTLLLNMFGPSETRIKKARDYIPESLHPLYLTIVYLWRF